MVKMPHSRVPPLLSGKRPAARTFIFLTLMAVLCHAAYADEFFFKIPPLPLSDALLAFSRQSDIVVTAPYELVQGKHAPAVEGQMSSEQALKQLLSGSGLKTVPGKDGALVVQTDDQAHRNSQGALSRTRESDNASAVPMVVAEAPTSGAANPGVKSQELQEIIVTARKRQESIFDVPVVDVAITQQQLQDRQTLDLKDVSKLVPGLSFGQSSGASGTFVSLRGIGTSAQDPAIDASVSLNVDGLQITQGQAFATAVFDLAQIEVLKGPQALFYGKNSPGGVISLHSADPTDKFELIGSYGHEFEANENRAQFIVSGPVSDSLRLRLATQYDRFGGYFTNDAVTTPGLGGLNPTSRSNPQDNAYFIRGTAIWQPSEQFDAHLKVNVSSDYLTGGEGHEYVSCPDGNGPVPGFRVPFLAGADCQRSQNSPVIGFSPTVFKGLLNGSGKPFNETNQTYGSLELNYRVHPAVTVTSVTGLYYLYFQSQQSGSNSTAAGPALVTIINPITRHDITEELRANSDFSGPLNFTAGAFTQEGRLLENIGFPGNTIYRLPASLGSTLDSVEIHSTSAFGQLRYQLVPTVEIDGGARWTQESRSLRAENLVSGSPILVPTSVPKISSDNVSPEATVTYKPTTDFMAFASYKQGFKSGSFNLGATTPHLDEHFGNEKAQGGEVGAKARWLNRALVTDVALYDYHYKGLQVGINEPTASGVPLSVTQNAGGALSYGVDFNASYLPPNIEGLRLLGAFEWNNSHFTSLNNVPCWGGQTIALGCNQSLNAVTHLFTGQSMSGQPLLRAPKVQANAGFDYELPIGRDLTLGIISATQFSSRYLTVLGLNRADFYQPSFVKTDLTLALRGMDDRWEFSVVGKNLSNEITSGSCASFNAANGVVFGGEVTGGTTRGPAGTDEVLCFMDRSREVWLRLSWRPFN